MNEEKKTNSDFTSLYCTTSKGAFVGYMNVPNEFADLLIKQLSKAKILAEVSDPSKKKARELPEF